MQLHNNNNKKPHHQTDFAMQQNECFMQGNYPAALCFCGQSTGEVLVRLTDMRFHLVLCLPKWYTKSDIN